MACRTTILLVVFAAACNVMFVPAKKKPETPDVCKDKWKLIFRGVSGNGESTYDAFMKKQPAKCTIKVGCLPDDVDPGFLKHSTRHLTSPLINKWSKLNIAKVKLELFRKGKVVVKLIFSTYGSSSTDWFRLQRLLYSSFGDLYKTKCIQSFNMNWYSLRFVIVQEGNCFNNFNEHDQAWMAVVDRFRPGSYCKWTNQSSYPAFLYGPNNRRSSFHQKYELADEMAIYITTV